MDFMQNKNKGFSGTQVMRIQSTQKTRDADFDITKNKLLSIPGVSFVSKTTSVPGDNRNTHIDTSTSNFKFNGKEYRMASVKVSTDYFKTIKVNLVKGRLFNDSYSDQNTRTAVINETAAKKLEMTNLQGETISFPHCDSVPIQVVGIVKDFNTHDFTHSIQPVVYTIGNKACMFQSGGAILVKLSSDHLQRSIVDIVNTWKTIEPDFPIRYSFLDDNFQLMLVSYFRLQKVINFFAIIAILISIMGLFALAALLTKQRTKEIGIRKILGANIKDISSLLSKDFMQLIVVAIVVSIPLAWWAANKWLETFVYRIQITWWLFGLAALIVILIALITISIQTIKVALANPVESLRSE
jgi:putative ABC transport system permease protein